MVLLVPALSWLLGVYDNETAEPDSGGTTYRSSGRSSGIFGILSSEYFRRGSLVVLLLMTAVEAVRFQVLFREHGESVTRKMVFHESYPRVLARALAEESRPIYLHDYGEPTYMLALWHGATWGYDKSNFVHLLDRQNPPEGALVISSKGSCTDCQVIYQDGFILYRNQKPDTSSVEAPIPANPAGAPSVFNA